MRKILFIIAILLPSLAFADQFKANIKADGKDIPAEFVTIGDNACALGSGFNACISQYTKGKIIIPKEVQYNSKTYQVQKVNALAFRFCTQITIAIIPEGVTSIGNFAFIGCTSLYEVELPATLQSLGSGSFINLANLKTVKCQAKTPPTWEYNDVFYFYKDGIGTTTSVTYEKHLYVPKDVISAYKSHKQTDDSKGWKTAEGWANFTAIDDGTETTFYIHNYNDLKKFRDNVNAHVTYTGVELVADIDCNNETWEVNIGDDTKYAFTGIFKGNGHTISHLTVKNKYAGLFARVQGGQVRNLTLKDCTFEGTETAGALCGRLIGSSKCVIDSVFSENNVVKSATECGGLVGHVSSQPAQINNCVVKGGKIEASNSTLWLGGIVGYVANASTATNVSDCAVLETTATQVNSKVGPFIAGAESGEKAYVANSFTTWDLGTSQQNKVAHATCVYKGAQYDYKNDKGITHRINFTPSKNEGLLAVGVLKLNNWVYCPGEYPLPACFENRLPEPKVNVMTLRPKSMPNGRVNGLTLANEDLSGIDFTDFYGRDNEKSFIKCEFVTTQLWVDDKLGGGLDQHLLPVTKMKITANNGVEYDRVLEAHKTGEKVVYDIPIFKTNEDGTAKFDEDGQPIVDGYETLEEDEFTPGVYPVLLPYETTMPFSCQVFKPAKVVSDQDGLATIELQEVGNRVMEANTPYYVVVFSNFVTLGTYSKATLDPQHKKIGLGNYEFTGTSYYLDKGAAIQNNLYQADEDDDLKWHVMTADNQKDVDVSAFRAFFRSLTGEKSAIKLIFETISDKDFEYEVYFDADDNRTLYVTKYKGEGGAVVVPNTVKASVGGEEQEMPVVYIDEEAFKAKADKIRSIDLTKCENLDGMYVDRNMKGNSFYGLKESTLVFTPEKTAFPSVNVVVGNICQKLLLKEGETFYSPYDFKAVNVEYERDMDANDFYTICLPYSAPAKDGVKYYALSGVSGATLQFNEVTETKPGVPYLVVTSSSIEDLDFDGDDKTTTNVVKTTVDGSAVNGYTMHGTFTKLSPAETVGKYILQAGNKWQKAKTENAAVYIDSFRAYLTGSANARELLDSELGDGTTAIKNIHTTDKDGTEQWYDLNGHRIDGNPSKKGVYIQKGKKVVLH